jgi:hypothetical protein
MSNSYLDVRVAYALAKIAYIAGLSDDGFASVVADARALGSRDADCNTTDTPPVPTFFADEPKLAEAWKGGFAEYAWREETADICSFCFKEHMFWKCTHL